MTTRRPRLRSLHLLALAAISLLLAGCFKSEQPKFPLTNAAAPFGDGGSYGLHERASDGKFERKQSFTLKRRSDGAYDFINEKGESEVVSLHDIGNGLFVGQAKSEAIQPPYTYYLGRMAGNDALIYVPNCASQDEAKLSRLRVERRGTDVCIIDGIANPTTLFMVLDINEPAFKLVRE